MSKRRRIPKLRVVERKLGREKAFGLCYRGIGLVEIDPRQASKEYLDTLIHEMLHNFFPHAAEWRVGKVATKMANVLWKHSYRRIKD